MHTTPPKIKARFLFLPLFIISLFIVYHATAQSGALDPSFGVGGKVTVKSGSNVYAVKTIVQPDGKILFAGDEQNDSGINVVLGRFKKNGDLDSSFGINGETITDLGIGSYSSAYDMDLDSSGDIIITGTAYGIILLAKYNSNGILDSSFGTKGISTFGVNGTIKTNLSWGSGLSVKVLTNGEILVTGDAAEFNHTYGVGSSFYLAKVKSDGSFDSSFGINGQVFTDFSRDYNDAPFSVAVTDDGKILLGGTTLNDEHGYAFYFAVAKYNTDGSSDTTFANKGMLVLDTLGYDTPTAMVLQKNGKILLAGTGGKSKADFEFVKYTPSGTKDSSFGKNGVLILDMGGKEVIGGKCLAEDANGRIIAAGISIHNADTLMAIVRFQENGALDKTFADKGWILNAFAGDTYWPGLALQKDGKIVVVGWDYDGKIKNAAIARYLVKNILPIQLSSFTTAKQNNHVLLNWQTATEVNNAYFIVQRSNNGKGFIDIGRVEGHGNSSITEQYSFIDNKPGSGINYYRLQQFDADNNFTYSNIISVDFSTADKYTIYPNPVKDVFTIDNLSGNATLTLLDTHGRVVLKTVTANHTYTGNIKALAAGVYYLQVLKENKTSTVKIVKE